MTDALSQALANAAYNTPKGEELHLENLDSIATGGTPVNPQEDLLSDWQIEQPKQDLRQPRLFREQYEQPLPMRHYERPEQEDLYAKAILSEFPLIKLRLDALADMITSISTTITTAASMQSEPNHKHRSLHEWDDSTLLNELVERENDLMPFYYELLKRIGSPELQSLVMSSMQGKNASMVTLAQLCSALAPTPIQPQVQMQQMTEHQMQEGIRLANQSYPSTIVADVPPQRNSANPMWPYTK